MSVYIFTQSDALSTNVFNSITLTVSRLSGLKLTCQMYTQDNLLKSKIGNSLISEISFNYVKSKIYDVFLITSLIQVQMADEPHKPVN